MIKVLINVNEEKLVCHKILPAIRFRTQQIPKVEAAVALPSEVTAVQPFDSAQGGLRRELRKTG
jgi:hypothetical protein